MKLHPQNSTFISMITADNPKFNVLVERIKELIMFIGKDESLVTALELDTATFAPMIQ